jgi:hypothetical protein
MSAQVELRALVSPACCSSRVLSSTLAGLGAASGSGPRFDVVMVAPGVFAENVRISPPVPPRRTDICAMAPGLPDAVSVSDRPRNVLSEPY